MKTTTEQPFPSIDAALAALFGPTPVETMKAAVADMKRAVARLGSAK
jgi:hypothetical protein